MKYYLKDMKHVIGFAAILLTLLAGMTFVAAGNAAVAAPNNDVAIGAMAVVPPNVLGANVSSNFNPAFNRAAINPFFNRAAINPFFNRAAINPFFVRPAINPFFGPAINPFFGPAINPFFGPAINPFFGAGLGLGVDLD